MQSTLKNRTIFCRDNLEVMRGIDSNTVDLIYLDPPFNKKKEFTAPIGSTAEGASFHDYFREGDIKEEWLGIIADEYPIMHDYIQGIGKVGHKSNKYYLCYMAVRLIEIHRILKDTGSLYLHGDPTMSHYLKILLDCIFGDKNFRNEIVWSYQTGGVSKKWFAKKHDIILFYSNSSRWQFNPLTEKSYNREYRRYNFRGVDEYRDERFTEPLGWYTMAGMRDVWNLSALGRTSQERLGYPTQKPLKLLERIIKASSNEGDLVLDPFCGCATTCVAAEKLGRQWIGIDVSEIAHKLVIQRLEQAADENATLFKGGRLPNIISRTDIPDKTVKDRDESERELQQYKNTKRYLYGKQEGLCKGCNNLFNYQNLTMDHIVPQSKGGGDNRDNLQLLCGHCNSVKGDRDMAFLKARLKEIKFLD